MEQSNFHDKLLAVQKEVGAIAKDSKNPFFNSAYFDINGLLAVVKPVLTKHGLVVKQPLVIKDGVNVLRTVISDGTDGMESEVILPVNDDPQKMGSIITYFRRYALTSLLALQAEDDDGNEAKVGTVQRSPLKKKFIASEKQVNFIKKLISEQGKPMPEDSWFKDLDSVTAKKAIDKLLTPSEDKHFEAEDHVEYE